MILLFHDYTSPASAVAVRRLQRLADEGLAVAFAGFDAVGIDVTMPVTLDVLAAIDAVSADARAEGVQLQRPPALPPTALAHLVASVAESHGLGASWRDVCYTALWTAGADLADVAVLEDLAERAGLPREEVAAALRTPGRLAALRREMGRHRRQGVGGVPTILAHRTLIPGLLPEHDLRALGM